MCWSLLIVLLLFCDSGLTLSHSKISFQTSFDPGTESWRFLNGAQPRLIKLLDDFSPAQQLKQMFPGIVIVGRIYLPNQPQEGDPVAAATSWIQSNNATLLQYPDVDYWEGYNEPGCGSDPEGLPWLTQFEIARTEQLAAMGLKASIGNFATGNPDITNVTLMEIFNPAIATAIKYGGVLGLHEYNSPSLLNCFDNSTGEGWMTGRYRMWYRQILIPANLTIPLVVSEFGIDNTGCSGSPNLGGWQKYCQWWQEQGYGSDCAQIYTNMIAWYDSLLLEDEFVIGTTIFQLEIGGWDDYSIAGDCTTDLIAYMNSLAY